jgi:hypothetical protein
MPQLSIFPIDIFFRIRHYMHKAGGLSSWKILQEQREKLKSLIRMGEISESGTVYKSDVCYRCLACFGDFHRHFQDRPFGNI